MTVCNYEYSKTTATWEFRSKIKRVCRVNPKSTNNRKKTHAKVPRTIHSILSRHSISIPLPPSPTKILSPPSPTSSRTRGRGRGGVWGGLQKKKNDEVGFWGWEGGLHKLNEGVGGGVPKKNEGVGGRLAEREQDFMPAKKQLGPRPDRSI